MVRTTTRLKARPSADRNAQTARPGPRSSVPPDGKKSVNIEKNLPAKRAKLIAASAENLDNDNFQLVTSKKDRKQIRGGSTPEREKENAKSGMARPVGSFVIEMQKPEAINSEWKQLLESGLENCPRTYFKKVPLSTNPNKRGELKRCVEVYLSLLNGNSKMFHVFFAQEETGYELADPAEKDSEYINFRLVISAYVLKAATIIMKEYIKIIYGMVKSKEGKWQVGTESATNIWKFVSPFTWQFVQHVHHVDLINEILDLMDHGEEAWSDYMGEAVQDFVNHKAVVEFPLNQIKFGEWTQCVGLREFGRTVRDGEELAEIEVVRKMKGRSGPIDCLARDGRGDDWPHQESTCNIFEGVVPETTEIRKAAEKEACKGSRTTGKTIPTATKKTVELDQEESDSEEGEADDKASQDTETYVGTHATKTHVAGTHENEAHDSEDETHDNLEGTHDANETHDDDEAHDDYEVPLCQTSPAESVSSKEDDRARESSGEDSSESSPAWSGIEEVDSQDEAKVKARKAKSNARRRQEQKEYREGKQTRKAEKLRKKEEEAKELEQRAKFEKDLTEMLAEEQKRCEEHLLRCAEKFAEKRRADGEPGGQLPKLKLPKMKEGDTSDTDTETNTRRTTSKKKAAHVTQKPTEDPGQLIERYRERRRLQARRAREKAKLAKATLAATQVQAPTYNPTQQVPTHTPQGPTPSPLVPTPTRVVPTANATIADLRERRDKGQSMSSKEGARLDKADQEGRKGKAKRKRDRGKSSEGIRDRRKVRKDCWKVCRRRWILGIGMLYY